MLILVQSISIFSFLVRLMEAVIPVLLRRTQTSRSLSAGLRKKSTDSQLIKSFSLLALGICLSTLSTLNFSLGFFIGVLCSPLAFLGPISHLNNKGVWFAILAFLVMQLISPLNWFYFIARLEFGKEASDLARMYRFAWKVWGVWTPLVWWCIWWPGWLAG